MSQNGFPRVTEILHRAGLVDTTWFTEEGRWRGSALHMAAQLLDEHDLDWPSVPHDVLLRLRQYQTFIDEVKPEILSIEETVTNEALRYVGHLDRRVKINGRESILDIKGPSEAAWNGVQLAAYSACFPRPLLRYNLYLSDDRYRLIEQKDRTDFEVFKAALTLAAWKEQHA